MNSDLLAITYGLSSALSWGAGDFSGGVASKRLNAYAVIFFAQLIGIGLLISFTLFFSETAPSLKHCLWGGGAGIAGAFGLAALYKGLAESRMGVVAPVSAVITAIIPIIFASITEGLPKSTQLIGFVIGLIAVWLIAHSNEHRIQLSELYLPTIAGIGFALFFILIDIASDNALLWPLVAARMASLSLITLLLVARRAVQLPTRSQIPWIVLAGILDVMGNAFFILAAQLGRLDVSTTLASLYPAATVILAWLILKEQLFRQQWFGVGAALVALVLIAI